MKEDVSVAAGRLMGEAIAMEQDFDLMVGFGEPDEFIAQYGRENYDRILNRRATIQLAQDGILGRTVVTPGNLTSLMARLRDVAQINSNETAHRDADKALLDFIGDERVRKLFDAIGKWYS